MAPKTPKKGEKSTIETADAATSDVGLAKEVVDVPTDVRLIRIIVEGFQNMKPLFPVSELIVRTEYKNEEFVKISDRIPVTDDPTIPAHVEFNFNCNILSHDDLDALISSPMIFSVFQVAGEADPSITQQLEEAIPLPKETHMSVDSAISLYEAFTGDQVEKPDSAKKSKKSGKQDDKSDKKDKGKGKSKDTPKSSKKDGTPDALHLKELVLGLCVLDFLPFFYGEESFSQTMEIRPAFKYADERMQSFKTLPRMSVNAFIDKPIHFEGKMIIMNFTVESIFNVPALIEPQKTFKMAARLPSQNSHKVPILFTRPQYKVEKMEEHQMKCWPDFPRIANNSNTTNYRYDTNLSNVKCKGLPKPLKECIISENPRLEFNFVRRRVLFIHGAGDLIHHIMKYKGILLEFLMDDSEDGSTRYANIFKLTTDSRSESKAKKKVADGLHLMVPVDVSCLVYPGVSKTRIACQLRTYQEIEAHALAGMDDSYFFPKVRPISEEPKSVKKSDSRLVNKTASKMSMKSSRDSPKAKKGAKGGSPKKNFKEELPPQPLVQPDAEPSIPVFNEYGDPTFIIIEIEFSEALIPPRAVEELTASLQDIVSPKPIIPKTVLDAKLAEKFYREVVKEVIHKLNESYSEYKISKGMCSCSDQADFLEFLRKTGSYQKFLTSLTNAAAVVVNKKFDYQENVFKENTKQKQDFVGKVFSYLVAEMNEVLNRQICSPEGVLPKIQMNTVDLVLTFAKEACEMKKYGLAERYLSERLYLDEMNSNVWFDYAVYHMEMDSPERAFVFLNETLLNNIYHKNTLLMYGLFLAEKGKYTEAETCVLNVLVYETRWVEAYGVLYLIYNSACNYQGMDFADEMATKYLEDKRTEHDYLMTTDDLAWTAAWVPNRVFLRTAALLLKMRMYKWVENALSLEITEHPGIVNYFLGAICYYKENYYHALEHLCDSKTREGWNYAITSLIGHCLMAMGEFSKAKEQYQHVLESFDRPDDMHLLYLNCARAMEMLGDNHGARKIILLACKYGSTAYTWLKAGILFYRSKDFLSAEECFSEANICDNRLPEVWAYLSLVNLKMDKLAEAELCYHQALKNQLEDPEILLSLKEEIAKF